MTVESEQRKKEDMYQETQVREKKKKVYSRRLRFWFCLFLFCFVLFFFVLLASAYNSSFKNPHVIYVTKPIGLYLFVCLFVYIFFVFIFLMKLV